MLAFVSGSSKGIGLAIAEALLHDGQDVILQSRNELELLALQDNLKLHFPNRKIEICPADLATLDGINCCASLISKLSEPIDILVNNAGVFKQGSLMEEPNGQLESLIETNVYSAYYLTRCIVPYMKKNKSGYIFNMCSIASIQAYPNGGSYSISKFALLGFSKCLREELKDFGIKVTAILPGATWSNSWKGVDLPVERLMQAKDIADIVISCLHLSSSAVMEEVILRPQQGDL